MLAKRIIPTVLCKGKTLIKGTAFNAWRSVGSAVQATRIHQARGVDELILLDIMATPENRGPDLDLVRELSEACFMPLSVGGGVRTVDDVKALLRAGADKVVIGSALYDDPYLAKRIADSVGSQALIASIDVKGGRVWVDCGKTETPSKPRPYAEILAMMGVGEIMVTSIEREGTLLGYDIPLIKEISKAVDVPVIASGGCGTYDHMLQAVLAGADAVAAGAMFQFTDATPAGAASFLNEQGVEVRC